MFKTREWFMKKLSLLLIVLTCVLGLIGCTEKTTETHIVNTYDETFVTYYEMSDGIWKTEDYTYKYKLEITGRLNNAVIDSTYIILSNTDDITFEEAWKASGLSSNTEDYFKPEDAIIVEMM